MEKIRRIFFPPRDKVVRTSSPMVAGSSWPLKLILQQTTVATPLLVRYINWLIFLSDYFGTQKYISNMPKGILQLKIIAIMNLFHELVNWMKIKILPFAFWILNLEISLAAPEVNLYLMNSLMFLILKL